MGGFTIFDGLVWGGASLTLVGIALLVVCVMRVFRAKARAQSDEELAAALRGLIPLNLGAVALSAIGLMMVVIGIFLA